MKRKTRIMTKAGVLLIAAVMLISALPAVMADSGLSQVSEEDVLAYNQAKLEREEGVYQPPVKPELRVLGPLDEMRTFDGVGAEGDILFEQICHTGSDSWSFGNADESLGYGFYENFELTADSSIGKASITGLPMYHDGTGWVEYDPNTAVFHVQFYDDAFDATAPPTTLLDDFTISTFETVEMYGASGEYSGYTAYTWTFELPSEVTVADQDGWMFVGAQILWGSSNDGDSYSYQVGGDPADTDYDRAMTLYEGAGGGGGPVGDCLEDQCDFVIASLNQAEMYEGKINELPSIINITWGNLGEVGIGELKLLADVYKKVCGPTTCYDYDEKYNLQTWESEIGDTWTIEDDGDGDSWVLQGGAENRWLTQNQAWRSTAGEDRSFGGDEDKYLGLCDTCSGPDALTWNPSDGDNIITGAACAEFTFNHWMEGEYTFDDDGNVVPVDYGTISYSLDDGATWTDVPLSDFVAFDTNDEWVEVNMKFINTAIYNDTEHDWQHAYGVVCDDCAPEEGEIVFYEEFPAVAELAIKFNFFKDPCYQFEGWYIDDLSLCRTEDYELELVHQTHEILTEIPGCDPEVDPWNYFEFPLGWDPEPDTWYQIEICGQVFSPQGCEIDVSNNCVYAQFYVTDIHDVMCKDIELLTDPVIGPGDTAMVNMTVKNIGTYAETDVPVELKVAKGITSKALDYDFESDPMSGPNGWSDFTGLFRWTGGDPSISNIYESDPAQARSVLPGEESFIAAREGYYYPQLLEGEFDYFMAENDVIPMSSASQATIRFDAKWSLECEQEVDEWGAPLPTPAAGSEGAKVCMLIGPTSGPASSNVWITPFGLWDHTTSGVGTYSNDWYTFDDLDLLAEVQGICDYTGGYEGLPLPDVTIGFLLVSDEGFYCTPNDGDCNNPINPVPWNGFMMDNFEVNVLSCDGQETVVDTEYIPTLAPGEEATVTLQWSDADYCNWCLIGDTALDSDVNTDNDRCKVYTRVTNMSTDDYEFTSVDLTGDGDCLWHLCNNRPGGDDMFAWAGIEEEQWAHYVNNMDDSFISPVIDLSEHVDHGVALNFTTYYELAEDADKGEVYVRGSPASNWEKLGEFAGSSGGVFVPASFIIAEEFCTATTQFRFRMYSDDEGVSEGWYVDDVEVVDITDIPVGAPGDTLWENTPYDGGTAVTSTLDSGLGFDYTVADDFTGLTGDIGKIKAYGLSLAYTGTSWVSCDPTPGMVFNVMFYDDAYGAAPTTPVQTFNNLPAVVTNEGSWWGGSYNLYSFEIELPTSVALTEGWVGVQANVDAGASCAFLWMNSLDDNLLAYQYDGTAWSQTEDSYGDPYNVAFELIEGAPTVVTYGDVIWFDDFEREEIAPWTCEESVAGDYWHHSEDTDELPNADTDLGTPGFEVINGYPSTGTGLNDVTWTTLDLTGDLQYVEFDCSMDYDFANEEALIEISTDWEPGTPMEDGTWVEYWHHTPGDSYGDNSGGWLQLSELVGDDRFILNQFIGEEIYLRFRLITLGEGVSVGDGWAIDDLLFIFKGLPEEGFVDEEAPVTSISYNREANEVSLISQDMPLDKNCGLKAIYYKLNGGEQQTYSAPFSLPEGETTVTYWAEDQCGNVESQKQVTYVVDTEPPTVEFVSPEEGKIYLFGSPLMDRILSDKTLCIGKVPIEVDVDDGDGTGVSLVTFSFDNGDSGFDDSAPFTYTYRGMHFGALTITATAIDGAGLTGSAQTEVMVYSLGLL